MFINKWYKEYFSDHTELFKWFEEISGQSAKSIEEIFAIAKQWQDENDDSFCNIYEYAVSDRYWNDTEPEMILYWTLSA